MLNHSLYFQILLNLLENASKFIKNNGWVLLEMDIFTSLSLSSFVYVKLGRSSVTDNGLGFKDKLMISMPFKGILLNVKKDKFGIEKMCEDSWRWQSENAVSTPTSIKTK